MSNTTPRTKEETLAYRQQLLADIKAQEARIQKLERDEKKYENKLLEHETKNKILYMGHPGKEYLGPFGTWTLNPAQKKVKDAVDRASYKLIALTGDNQIGKTLMETILVIAFMRGYWPWEDPLVVGRHLWDRYNFEPPIHIRWIGSGWEEHIQRTLINEGLSALWPADWQVKKHKNNTGVDYHWIDLETKSYLYFMSSGQETIKFAGSKCHLVIFDEKFPKDIWDENVARILSKGGFIFVGATLDQDEDLWLYDEILDMEIDSAKKKEKIFHVEAAAVVNLGHGTKKEWVDDGAILMTKEGRERRLGGQKLKSFGRVLHYDDKNIIPRISIPPDWVCVAAVDIGGSKCHDILFMAIDSNDRRYFIFEEEVNGSGTKIGELIISIAKRHSLRLERVIIDPLAKMGQSEEHNNVSNSIYNQLDDYLFKFGVPLEAGSKKKEEGVTILNDKFKGRIPNYPDAFIFNDLYKTIAQCKIRRDKLGGIPKKNDDQFENMYRLALDATVYYDPEDTEEADSAPQNVRKYY